MRPVLLAVFLGLHAPASVRADGCKFATDGRTVPEREQRALVEWADGTETLYVAALSDPTTGGSVWVVPVRSAAADVRAEPVEEFPAVVFYTPLRKRAEQQLRDAVLLTGLLDSGGLCCPLAIGGCGGAGAPKSAVEESRVEKYGMVVTVVSADTRDALATYLAGQGVNTAAVNLSSLDWYFGRAGYSFVCGWVAPQTQLVTATGLKVVFPSPTLWFPLLPTRAYTEPVETVVYTRGFVRPADGCDLPGLKCEYVFGRVEARGVGAVFRTGRWDHIWHDREAASERMTRVTLTTDPQQWDRDLELVPGTTTTGTVAVAVVDWGNVLGILGSTLIGAALGLFIPWVTVSRAERRRGDWLAGAVVGAVIIGSLWASLVAFSVWRWHRFPNKPRAAVPYLVLPALAVVHFVFVSSVCYGLIEYLRDG